MKRLLAQPGRWPRLLVIAACVLVAWLYGSNEDMAGQPDAPRGNGEYLPILDRGDGHMLYLMARSTALDLDWNFDNDLQRFGDPWGQPRGPNGHKQIPHPIGPALVWTPLIWLAEAGAVVANELGAGIPLHGYTPWHQRFVFLSSVLAAIGAVLLGRRLARDLVGGRWAAGYAAIAVLLGTSLTYYATYMPSYGHALDAGACAAFLGVWALTVGRWELKRWLGLGLLLGLAMLVRMQDLALGVVIVVEVGAKIVADLRRRAVDWRVRAVLGLGGGALVLAVALCVFVPQLVYWHELYGKWLAFPQGAKYTRLGSPMILELLWAPRNGWLSSHPIAYLGVIGLACVPRRARLVAAGLGAALVLQVYLNATILDWWGMASFGQRRLCSMTLPLVVGLAALLWRMGRLAASWPRGVRHAISLAVLGPMVAWNLWRLAALGGGKSASSELEPTCCDKVPHRLHGVLETIYDRIGNPFELPASAWYALRHHVELQRWDVAVGYYPLVPPPSALLDDSLQYQRGAWRLGYPKAEPYLVGAWSPPAMAERAFRWTLAPTVRALVPNLMPYGQRFSLWLAPGGSHDVVLRWDGAEVVRATLHDGWNKLWFDMPEMPVGEHELTIEAALGMFPGAKGWPTADRPVGVAVNLLELELLPL